MKSGRHGECHPVNHDSTPDVHRFDWKALLFQVMSKLIHSNSFYPEFQGNPEMIRMGVSYGYDIRSTGNLQARSEWIYQDLSVPFKEHTGMPKPG